MKKLLVLMLAILTLSGCTKVPNFEHRDMAGSDFPIEDSIVNYMFETYRGNVFYSLSKDRGIIMKVGGVHQVFYDAPIFDTDESDVSLDIFDNVHICKLTPNGYIQSVLTIPIMANGTASCASYTDFNDGKFDEEIFPKLQVTYDVEKEWLNLSYKDNLTQGITEQINLKEGEKLTECNFIKHQGLNAANIDALGNFTFIIYLEYTIQDQNGDTRTERSSMYAQAGLYIDKNGKGHYGFIDKYGNKEMDIVKLNKTENQ